MLPLSSAPHRRLNPLTGEWLVVSPHRTQRPWLGEVSSTAFQQLPEYDPTCYLCPGNTRAGGVRNPRYTSTFVFDNDYPALLPESDAPAVSEAGLLVAEPERGLCRVACFSPRHDLTLARMSTQEIEVVIRIWAEQFADLGSRDFVRYVQVFENRGAMMGASNPHPHCQIWATESVPDEPAKEQRSQLGYTQQHGSCLLCDYAKLETKLKERVLFRNRSFVIVVPFWAVWPFEVLIVSQRHLADITQLSAQESLDLAVALHTVTSCYDSLFQAPFPYSMGFHQQPTDGAEHAEWHFHAHFYPPLLRSAGIRKFMVGFEMLGSPQRDITAESAAQRLREVCQGVNEKS